MVRGNALLLWHTGDGRTIAVRHASHPRAVRIRLTVGASGARVSYPRGTSLVRVNDFIQSKGPWLERTVAKLGLAEPSPELRAGAAYTVNLRGQAAPLHWHTAEYATVHCDGLGLHVHMPAPHDDIALLGARGLLRAFLETQLRGDIQQWLPGCCALLGGAPQAIRVRPLKSMWGSLDAHDGMTLDLSLALAPAKVLRYVLAHELCHLLERNHSAAFWRHVATLDADWREHRAWLRIHGQAIKLQLRQLLGAASE